MQAHAAQHGVKDGRLPAGKTLRPDGAQLLRVNERTAAHTGFHRLSGQLRHLRRHKMLPVERHAAFRQPAPHAAGHAARVGGHSVPDAHMVRKALHHGADHGRPRRREIRLRHFPGFPPAADGQKLPIRHPHFPRPTGGNAPAGARPRLKPGVHSLFHRAPLRLKIRIVRRIAQVVVQAALHRHALPLHQGRNGGKLHHALFILPGRHQARQPRRQRKSGHPSSHVRQAPVRLRSSQGGQQVHGPLHHQGVRRIQPAEPFRRGYAPRGQIQHGPRQIHPETFGRIKIRLPRLLRLTPQPEAAARSHAPGTARALGGGRLGNLRQVQRIHAPVGVPAGPAHQTGINHRAHPLNRQGGFRYIGGNDDAGILPLLHGAILLFRGQRSVKRKNVPAAHPRFSGFHTRPA